MKKTIVSLTERQMKAIAEESEELGISKSELIRRLLDKHIDSKSSKIEVRE